MTNPTAPRRAAVIFIFITVVLDVLALGVIIPVLPKLVLGFVEGKTEEASAIYGLFGTIWAAMQFVFSPIMGALSDRFGRRKVILMSNFGLGFDYIVMAMAPNLSWLFIGRIISGITAASISTAGAYIADVTTPDKRSAGFGMLGAAFGLGFVLGPALGGILGQTDPRLPFWVAAGLSLANACYGAFVLPESLPIDKRSAFNWRRANPIGSLALLRTNPKLGGMALVTFVNQLAHNVLPSVFVLYAGYRYQWDERTTGLTLASVGVFSMIVQGGLVRPFVKRFGERTALMVGYTFGAAGFLIYGLANTGTMFVLGTPVMAVWGLSSAASQGMMTKLVEPTEQGRLQGATSSVRGIADMIGPTLFTMVFAWAIGAGKGWHLPGAPFLLASGLMGVDMVLGSYVTRPRAG